MCMLFRGEIFEFKPWALFGFFSLVNYVTYSGIDRSLALGLTVESYEYLMIFEDHLYNLKIIDITMIFLL